MSVNPYKHRDGIAARVRRDRVFVVPIPKLTYLTETRPDPDPDKEPVRDFEENAAMNEWNTPKC